MQKKGKMYRGPWRKRPWTGEADAGASIHPFKALSFPDKRPRNLARSQLLVGSRRKKTDRGQRPAFPSQTSRFVPLILAHKSSTLPWLVNDRAALYPRRIWFLLTDRACHGTLARAAAPYQDFRDSVTCLSRTTTSQRTSNWSSEEAHHVNTILHHQTAAAFQPTG